MTYLTYRIIVDDNATNLTDSVNDLLAQGWVLQGGVSLVRYEYENARKGYTETEWVWAQAMTK